MVYVYSTDQLEEAEKDSQVDSHAFILYVDDMGLERGKFFENDHALIIFHLMCNFF